MSQTFDATLFVTLLDFVLVFSKGGIFFPLEIKNELCDDSKFCLVYVTPIFYSYGQSSWHTKISTMQDFKMLSNT